MSGRGWHSGLGRGGAARQFIGLWETRGRVERMYSYVAAFMACTYSSHVTAYGASGGTTAGRDVMDPPHPPAGPQPTAAAKHCKLKPEWVSDDGPLLESGPVNRAGSSG